MHVGIELDEQWIRAARTKGLPQTVHAIPDRHDPRVLATRLGVELSADGALVGQLAHSHASDAKNLKCAFDFRDRLGSSEPILSGPDGREWTAAGLLAVCLRNVYRNVLAMSDGTWDSVTITIPTWSSNAYRQHLLDAVAWADLPPVMLLEEPLAAWWYVKHGHAAPGPSLVIDIGDISSSFTILHEDLKGPRLDTTVGLPSTGKKSVLENLARHLASAIVRQLPPTTDQSLVVDDVLRQIHSCGIDTLDSRKFPSRYHWLIQGRICEVVLLSSSMAEARQTLIDPLQEKILEECDLQTHAFRQIVLTRNAAHFPELVNWLHRVFPAAQIHGTDANGERIYSFGAALVSPAHPAWKPIPARFIPRKGVHADLGLKIWNPAENRTDLDVLFPADASPPQRVERYYRPNLAESASFTLELAERGEHPSDLVSIARLDIPLKPWQNPSHIKVSVELVTPSRIEFHLHSDMIDGTESKHVVELPSDGRAPRLSAQRRLVEGISFIES